MMMRGLKSFTNVEFVTDVLCEKHKVPASQRPNVRSQAESIRSCLQQGLEYRDAAIASDFSRPTLIYYSIMSLALCEILFKRDANYRLGKLREKHAHHGLDFSFQGGSRYQQISASDLAVRPLDKGTFHVWYETSEDRGTWGEVRTIEQGGGQTSGLRMFAHPAPGLRRYNFQRVDLTRLAQNCPGLFYESSDLGISLAFARVSLDMTINKSTQAGTWRILVHPGERAALEQVLKRFMFHPRAVDLLQVREFENGVSVSVDFQLGTDYLLFSLSGEFAWYDTKMLLSGDDINLNEFGIYYLSSYIAGMFARYYPELWAKCSEHQTSLYLLIDAMMNAAIERAPMLLLEEFRREVYVLS